MKCPICRKPASPTYSPFCGKRCADVDLGKWLTGSYAIFDDAEDETSEDDSGHTGSSH